MHTCNTRSISIPPHGVFSSVHQLIPADQTTPSNWQTLRRKPQGARSEDVHVRMQLVSGFCSERLNVCVYAGDKDRSEPWLAEPLESFTQLLCFCSSDKWRQNKGRAHNRLHIHWQHGPWRPTTPTQAQFGRQQFFSSNLSLFIPSYYLSSLFCYFLLSFQDLWQVISPALFVALTANVRGCRGLVRNGLLWFFFLKRGNWHKLRSSQL